MRFSPTCGSCGRTMDSVEAWATIDGRPTPLCHPLDPALPDCYTEQTRDLPESVPRFPVDGAGWVDITWMFDASL